MEDETAALDEQRGHTHRYILYTNHAGSMNGGSRFSYPSNKPFHSYAFNIRKLRHNFVCFIVDENAAAPPRLKKQFPGATGGVPSYVIEPADYA